MWTIVIWIPITVLLAAWSGALWALHALLAAPQAAVLAAQRWLHALPTLEAWGEWAADSRDALVNAVDSLLLVLSMAGGALQAWWPGVDGWVAPLLWAAWAVGAALLLLIGASVHALVRVSARDLARAQAS